MKKLIIGLVVMLSGPAWAQKAEPLVFREKIFDFGVIDESKGPVDHEFIFTNTAGIPVRILSVNASCGCTTPGWTQSQVLQGKTGVIKASFDPRGRPGYFNKSLTVFTDIDQNPVMLYIKGEVSTESTSVTDEFSVVNGNLRFTTKSFNFETIYLNKAPVLKVYSFINKGPVPVELLSAAAPAYMKVEMPLVIGPNARGNIKVTYDARKKNQFGFSSDNIQITTNDPGAEVKLFPVYATLEEFYPIPTPEEAKKGPVLFVREPIVDLGRFRDGEKIEKSISILNKGKKELLIKAFQGNCSCISAELDRKSIPPGDSAVMKIIFKPQNRGGTQLKAITLYSNDPVNSVQRINLQAYIEEH